MPFFTSTAAAVIVHSFLHAGMYNNANKHSFFDLCMHVCMYVCIAINFLHQVAEAEVTEKEIDESRERYRPVAYRGAIMYFCVRDFNVVDPMYQYSLQWFTNLFVQVSSGALVFPTSLRPRDKGAYILFLRGVFTAHFIARGSDRVTASRSVP